MKRRDIGIAVGISLVLLAIRLYFILSTKSYSYDAYYAIRIIGLISEGNIPLNYDFLSYGGRALFFPPLFYYLLALLNYIFGDWMLKAAPQIFISTMPIIVFYSVKQLTNRQDSAIFSSVMSVFVPILLSETLFTLSPLTIALPLTYLAMLLIFKVPQNVSIIIFVLLIFLLSLTHPSAIILIFCLLGYLLISRLAGVRSEDHEIELILFSVFIFIWTQFILYKNAFLYHGIGLISGNIPLEIISGYFSDVSIAGALLQIGLLPLIGGLYSIYKHLFKVKNKYTYLYISMALISALFTWLRLVEPNLGFVYLAISLCILSGSAYSYALVFFHNIRFKFIARYYLWGVAILLITTIIIPSFYFVYAEASNTVPIQMQSALTWLKENTPAYSGVLTIIKEGHLITAIANRRNIIDDNFILIDNPSAKLKDVRALYTTPFITDAVTLMERYDIDYIMVSASTSELYKIDDLSYSREECIKKVFQNDFVIIYRPICLLGVVK